MTVTVNQKPFAQVGPEAEMPTPLAVGGYYKTTDTGKLFTSVPGLVPGTVTWLLTAGGAAPAPTLATVLVAGNDSGPTSILLQPAQRLDTDQAPTVPIDPTNLLRLGTVNAARIEIGKLTAPVVGNDDVKIFINQGGVPLPSITPSNAGIQYSSLFPNRAQLRVNAFGNHGGLVGSGHGITAFKSRGLSIGALVPVIAGDSIFRVTAIGVPAVTTSLPLSGMIDINVAPNGVPVAAGYIATEFAVRLVPLEGPVNGHQEMFKVTSQGALCMREAIHVGPPSVAVAAGVITLTAGAFGTTFVPNVNITANTRITLTVQDQVPAVVPLGSLYVLSRVIGPLGGFTIQSTAPIENAVAVYYQFWEPVNASS